MAKRKFKMITITVLTAALTFIGAGWGMNRIKLPEVEAAIQQKETVNLRIIGTTDLHGQLNSKDYEQGMDYSNGGLARVFDLIRSTRAELPEENSITLDAGDVLYDYTTEYIFSENQDAIQPIYQAMAQIGYDAITLGNHDFDYGYEYIQRQLNGAGLRDVTVVSNVMDSKTGEYPFQENMLITRRMKTSSGNDVEIKIGIIGQTIPVLTAKTHSYKGILKTEDMVENAQKQAVKLKEMGADIVIALSHTGIGPETPELNFKNVAYAITKIPEIDVVVCGHEHNLFPTTDMTSPYYKLPNVDKKTYLMNGKNVIMAGNRGNSIGVADLTLEVEGDSIQIAERKSEIRMVNAQTTIEDIKIAGYYGTWEEELSEYSTKIIAKLAEGTIIHNFYGLLGDNAAIQLLNDSKMDYAIRYTNTTGKSYRNYPIVAASTYASYGAKSVDDFINIQDSITESQLTSIQPYNDYLYIYTITGKQLKEWLEWSASAYETLSFQTSWSNTVVSDLMKQTGFQSLIKEEWLGDWSSFYIFDGVDYVIDPSREPRYDISGNIISNSSRISSLKYNGSPVTEDMVMLLVTNKITQPTDANTGVEKQIALNGFTRAQSVLSNYISQISNGGSIVPQLDYNWRVSLPSGNHFLVKAPNYAHDLISNAPWQVEYLTEANEYCYYSAAYPVENGDITGPHIVASPTITSATNSVFEVGVQASDSSEIVKLCYLYGGFAADSNNWPTAPVIHNQRFIVRKNGIYSIYAEDSFGNKSVYQLNITNFSDNLLGSPSIDSYTNRKTKISGRAEPNTTIVFEAYTGIYESKVSSFGTFSYPLPSQPSGTEVVVYIKDETRGLVSERVRIQVKRTGPNQPSINPLRNNAGYITGDTDDSDATVIAMIGDTVYVSEQGGKELYEKNSEIYDKSLEIVETYVDINDMGYFIMLLPAQEAGAEVYLYNIDHLSRNSRMTTTTVDEIAPNAPVVFEVANIENSLNGYIPGPPDIIYDITLAIGSKTYNTKTDKDGSFSFQFQEQLVAGQKLTVVAYDNKNGTTRISYPVEVIVKDINQHVRTNSVILNLDTVTDKSSLIRGYHSDKDSVYLAITKGEGTNFQSTLYLIETDGEGNIEYPIEGKLEVGTNIYAMVRFTNGRILLASKTVVILGKPYMPELTKEISNSDKLVQIIAEKDCVVNLTIGTKTYVSSTYVYEEDSGKHIYSFETDRAISGTVIKVTATNAAGTSGELISSIIKTAPDQPQVNEVKAGDKVITGKVELLGDIENTQTRIFAKIGKKTYEGVVDHQGNYSIKIPSQLEGSKINVWGTNNAGRGPLISVIVTK